MVPVVSGLLAGPVWVVPPDYRTGWWLGGDALIDDEDGVAWWSGYWLDADPVPGVHTHCDGCDDIRPDVCAVGRDGDGEPDAPDLCGMCRERL